jgi:hypothetical protein
MKFVSSKCLKSTIRNISKTITDHSSEKSSFNYMSKKFVNSGVINDKENKTEKFDRFVGHHVFFHDVDNKQVEPSFLQMVRIYFNKASGHLDIPKYYLELIKATKTAIRFSFPLVKDDGTIQMISAFRAQNSLHQLPTKGGIRFSENLGNYFIKNVK